MRIELNKLITSTENQTRAQMYDVRHVDTIEQSLINSGDVLTAITKIPPIIVEEMMNAKTYKVIDGHHRFEVFQRLAREYPEITTIEAVLDNPKTSFERVLQGFDANCDDRPRKTAGMAELEIALSKLHAAGTNIHDASLQQHFQEKLNHKTVAQVARVVNKITTRVDPVDVVPSAKIDEFYEDNQDAHTTVKHSQSTKWQQGLGYLLEAMAEEDKEQGVLLIYFADGLKKKRYDYGKVLSVIKSFDLSIEVQYLN